MKRVKGVVKNNVVVLEEGAQLPEGTEVEVRVRRGKAEREAERRRKIKEAIDQILANQITRYVGMDEVIEEVKREMNLELPDDEAPAS
jgi:hypothetical protein